MFDHRHMDDVVKGSYDRLRDNTFDARDVEAQI